MTRLIDADALMEAFAVAVKRSNNSDFARVPTWNDAVSLVEEMPTVDAITVELIQKRIEYLRELANYAFDTNGGYVEHTHMRLYELEELLEMWEERKKNEQIRCRTNL